MDKQKRIKESNEIHEYVEIAEDKTEEMKDKYFESQTLLTAMKSQVKHLTKQTAEIEWLRDENLSLNKQIKQFKNVELLVSGTQNDVEEILKTYGDGQGSLKQMAVYCSLLKKELQNATDTKVQLRNEMANLKKDLEFQTSELNKRNNKIKKLNNTVHILEEENSSLGKKAKLSNKTHEKNIISSSSILYESPTPVRIKREHGSLTEDRNISSIITPSAKRFRDKKVKVNMVSSLVSCNRQPIEANSVSLTNSMSLTFTTNPFKSQSSNENGKEYIRNGFNGLGGHSKFVERSQPLIHKLKPVKKKINCKTLDNYIKL